MVNYDLPWNPNRLERRFGRIHRIGQTEVRHWWNPAAADTREGAVQERLLEKLEAARAGWAARSITCWANCSRRGRCATCSSTRSATASGRRRARLLRAVDGAVDTERVAALAARGRLAGGDMGVFICFADRSGKA